MEGIVVGIAQINFHQSLGEVSSNSNCVNKSISIMTDSESSFRSSEEDANVNDQEKDHSSCNNSNENTYNDSVWEEIEDDLENERQVKRGYTFSERRQMPRRSTKESSLSAIKHRTKMKPAKRLKSHEDFKHLKPSQIKKLYLNKKLTNFRPSSLETIFEEASTSQNNEENSSHLMGGRKIKRSLSLPDGFRYNKTLLNKRRAKIKKNFGKRFALKKISFEEFITKLNNSIEKNENESGPDSCMDDINTQDLSQTDNFCFSNTSETIDGTTDLSLPNLSCSQNNIMFS